MDISNIPDHYFALLFEEIPFPKWREFFAERGKYADYLKGFRPHKVPPKVLEPVVFKLLREEIDFRQEVLKLWREERAFEIDLSIYTAEYIQDHLPTLAGFLGRESLFWLCYSDTRSKVQQLAPELLEEDFEEGESPTELESLRAMEEKLGDRLQESMEKKMDELETKIRDQRDSSKKLASDKLQLKEKLSSKNRRIKELQKERENLNQRLDSLENHLQGLERENARLKHSLPENFTPCSIVVGLEERLRGMEQSLAEIEKMRYKVESLEAREEEHKKTHAELLQQVKEAESEKEQLQREVDYYKSLAEKTQIPQKPQKPKEISTREIGDKVVWPSDAHHYPKRLAPFLEKLARSSYVDQIYIIEFENSSHTRLKSIDEEGNIYLLYSDGQKAAKVLLKTTAQNPAEGLYVEGEIRSIDSSIESR